MTDSKPAGRGPAPCVLALALLLGGTLSSAAQAAAEDVERLGKDLTCLGADPTGNADGSIPPFTGQWLGAPP
ncbi:hypothetical protein D3C80_2066620 [compost metagenome]